MVASNLVLIPGGGGVGRAVFVNLRAQNVLVRFMVRREDERAGELKGLGAEVVIGDLTRPETVAAALQDVGRMFFAMAVSTDHLLAATVVASVAKEYGKLEALVDLSQMTVSQMTATSTAESHQQRLHWLAEQVLNWSGLPVVHVARVVATVLRDPASHIGHVYELTGPRSVDMTEMAAAFSRALGRSVSYVDVPLDRWQAGLSKLGMPPHTEQHVATMARLHRDNRYDRIADGVERVTGVPPQSIEAFVAARKDFYLGFAADGGRQA